MMRATSVAAFALAAFCLISAANAADPAGKLSIAVIPKGTTHSYWKAVEAGARQAEQELGINVIFKGPLKEDDRAEQIKVVEQFVSQGVDGVVLAPLDDTALVRPVRDGSSSGIPFVIIDSALKAKVGTDYVSYVATDNVAAGAKAGAELARLLGGKGKVVLLRYAEGSASTTDRETGFLNELAKSDGVEVTVKDRFGGATAAESEDASMKLADRLNEADGIFTPNESSTQGMLLALRKLNLAGKKKFVGFDAPPQLIEALSKGEIDALVSQDPKKMGYEAVKTIVAKIKGQPFEAHIDTGAVLLTGQNLQDPAIKQLIGTQ